MTRQNPRIERPLSAVVQKTYEPDVTVSMVARHLSIQPNRLFAWRKLAPQGALTDTAPHNRWSGHPNTELCRTR
ncbi:transposase [Sinorhizobium medicae]|nr:transposase [Sinorhizobium medicae]